MLINTISVIAAGVLVLILWLFNIPLFKQPVSEVYIMNPTLAVELIFGGFALLLLSKENGKTYHIRTAQCLSFLVILIAGLKLLTYFHISDVKVDAWFFYEKFGVHKSPFYKYSVLMPINSAVRFLLLGVSLLLLSYKRVFCSQSLSLITASLTVLSFFGYMHNMPEFHLPFPNSFLEVPGTICVLMLSISILIAEKDKGYMAEIISQYSGGRMARNLIPMILFVPLILDVLRFYGERSGLFGSSFGLVLFFCTILVLSLFTILNSIKSANEIDLKLDTEIEERKKAEIEIKHNNQFLEAILENIPNMIFVKEAKDLRFVTINKAGEQLLGIPRNEYIGKTDDDVFPKEQANFFKQKDWQVFKSESLILIEEEPVFTKEGQRWLRTKKIPIKDENGNPLYLVGISEDITEVKRQQDEIKQFYAELEQKVMERTEELSNSEKRFRALIENSTDCITITNDSSVIIYESPAVERVTGYLLNERAGRLLFMDVHPDDVEKCEKLYDELVKNPGIPIYQQYRICHKNGKHIWVEGTATNLICDGSVKAMVFNYRDITERKHHEQERELLIHELTKHNKSLRQFSYITSHNLRAPLANMLGLLGLINLNSIEDPSLKEILEGFNVSTNSLNDTINDLLKILFIKENTAIEQEEVHLYSLFQKVTSQVSTLLEEVDPEIELNFQQDCAINFNRAYLESIFLNLLTNAIKYRSANRKLRLTVKMREYDTKSVLSFQDNGIGLDLEKCRSKVFGLYQRFHNNLDSKGLGLCMVKSQMEALGGTIDIESTVDAGTKFILTFNKPYADKTLFADDASLANKQ